MAEFHKLYQQARYYDIALARDVSREVDFIIDAFAYYHGGRLNSVLEIACGPGYHARELARRGVQAKGLDLESEMIQYASERANAEGLKVDWIVSDMRRFRLDEPVEMAICMFDGLDALTDDEALIEHFCVVSENLLPAGLYLIDLTHPREADYAYYSAFKYEGERDGMRVEIIWGTNQPQFDLVTGVARCKIKVNIYEGDKHQVIREEASERLLFPKEINLLARLSSKLQVIGWHGDYDLKQPLDYSEASRRIIGVLKKID